MSRAARRLEALGAHLPLAASGAAKAAVAEAIPAPAAPETPSQMDPKEKFMFDLNGFITCASRPSTPPAVCSLRCSGSPGPHCSDPCTVSPAS